MNIRQTKGVIPGTNSKISVFHIGGRGAGFGPTDRLLGLGKDINLYTFEASIGEGDVAWDEYVSIVNEYKERLGIELSVIQACISNHVGKQDFHVNIMPDCSSLLNMNPSAARYQRKHDYHGKTCKLVWNKVCKPSRTVNLDVTTLDELYQNKRIPLPDFLSIDTQGVEYDILQGASAAFKGNLLGIILEGEFSSLYENQKLFPDQYTLLTKQGFRLFDFYNTEYWYTGPVVGKGALTVVESLFLRNYEYFISKHLVAEDLLACLSKLAVIALKFERQSYAYEILEYIMNNHENDWRKLVNNTETAYIKLLDDYYSYQSRLDDLPDFLDLYVGSDNVDEKPGNRIVKYILWLAYNMSLKMIMIKIRSIFQSKERKRLGISQF